MVVGNGLIQSCFSILHRGSSTRGSSQHMTLKKSSLLYRDCPLLQQSEETPQSSSGHSLLQNAVLKTQSVNIINRVAINILPKMFCYLMVKLKTPFPAGLHLLLTPKVLGQLRYVHFQQLPSKEHSHAVERIRPCIYHFA